MSRAVELALGLGSAAMFVGTLLAAPWILARLPADHFVRQGAKDALPRRVARNVLGAALVLAGIAMLVLPGQGILTIFVGLTFLDFPMKKRLVCWMLRHETIGRAVERLRKRAGRPPLVIPKPA